ncbi:MAG: hypothetical protein IKB75_00095 [Clostridia bacterium]|nr:hypothetical protein [Clostridia bacterium]
MDLTVVFWNQPDDPIVAFFAIVVALVVAFAPAVICPLWARAKGREVVEWLIIGLFAGWIGVIILWVLPDLTVRRSRNLFYQTGSSSTRKIHTCPNCGSTLSSPLSTCEICGYHPGGSSAASPRVQRPPVPKVEIRKVEKYRCSVCSETIDTVQCPWCGNRKG